MTLDQVTRAKFERLQQQLEFLPKKIYVGAVDGGLEAGEGVKEQAQDNLDRQDANASRQLRESISVRLEQDTSNLSFTVRIGTGVDHAKYVERGTGSGGAYPSPSGMPPKRNIEAWVRAKNIIVEESIFAIRKSIQENGTPKQPFLRPAFLLERENIMTELRESVQQSIRSF